MMMDARGAHPPAGVYHSRSEHEELPRDSSGDQGCPGAQHATRSGLETHAMVCAPAGIPSKRLLAGGPKEPARAEAIRWNGHALGNWHVWGEGWMGDPIQNCQPSPHDFRGGIGEKPGVMAGHIVIREYLSMTLSMDHDMIDGATVARFTMRLKELIEGGCGLIDEGGEEAKMVRAATEEKGGGSKATPSPL